MANPYLEIQGLTKRIGHRILFENISFTVNEREHIGLIAKNGTGKSTLLSIIAGKESDDGGKMVFRNGIKVGYLEQSPTIDAASTQQQGEEFQLLYRQYLTQMKITEEESQRPATQLSGGQVKRIALAKVLAGKPDLLILDEPTNHLDLKTKDVLKQALQDYDGTLIIVSHDRDFLDGLVTKVYEFGHQRVREHLCGIYEFLDTKKLESLQELERKGV